VADLVLDEDVAQLFREQRLLEAAAIAESRGQWGVASAIYERACTWDRAARAALEAGDAIRGLSLAIEADDADLATRALARIPADSPSLPALGSRLRSRGRDAWAARVFEEAGQLAEAALAWEHSSTPERAAPLRERLGDPVGAAKALETALRRDPQSWTAAVALGELLLRYEKLEAAVRILQRVPAAAPERERAVRSLLPAVESLGLRGAIDDLTAEVSARGWSLEQEPLRAAPKRGARLFGRYDVVSEAASSPTARVLECVDVVRGERVAVKVFAGWDLRGGGRDAVARFDREVRAMRALDHPHIVPMLDFVAEGPAMVLSWMEGGTLEKLLAEGTAAIAPARAVEIATAVLSALGEAHRLGILHRDVKPANVLFDSAGGARLGDFGVAHLADLSTTATAGEFGTLAYMSPEQKEGRPATTRSDVFAVGVMLREMLTGDREGLGGIAPSQAHRGLSERHDLLVASLAAADPALRPPDAFSAREALSALPWPLLAEPVRRARPQKESAARGPGRLEEQPGGWWLDTWTGRPVERIPLHEATLARAQAFACADHPGLQGVLRVDRDGSAIWLEETAPAGRGPTEEERDLLRAALGALHAQGVAHGSVDAAHLGVTGEAGQLVLRFSLETAVASTDGDLDALVRL
jgi:serine/threonine-protein kinase